MLLSIIDAVNNSSSTVVSGSSLAASLYFQNKFCTVLFLGALFNAVVGKVLKILISEKRPSDSARRTHGMPSSHASALSFFVAYLSLGAFNYYPSHSVYIALGTAMYTLTVCWCRVYRTHDHTIPQILVGLLVGSMMGSAVFELQRSFIVDPIG